VEYYHIIIETLEVIEYFIEGQTLKIMYRNGSDQGFQVFLMLPFSTNPTFSHRKI
jgi:hypothetical protein